MLTGACSHRSMYSKTHAQSVWRRHGPHQKPPINLIEEAPDVEVDHPVMPPASLPRHGQCIVCRSARAVSIGVGMEHRFQYRLQVPLDYRLDDAIRDRRYAERPRLSTVLRYIHPAHRQGSNCPTTCDSRANRDCSSNRYRMPQSTRRPLPPLPGLPSPACMLPTNRASQYKMVSLCP